MSYQGYPPYGQAPAQQWGQQPPPPQGGYYPPPHPPAGPYGQPQQQQAPPIPPHPYAHSPQPYMPPPQPYNSAPQPYNPPTQPYNQSVQPYGAPPQPYGQPPAQYGQPPYAQQYAPQYPPTPPSLGYGPPQPIAWNGEADAQALRSAMKGFGTNEKLLIRTLANKDPLQIAVINETFTRLHRRNLESDIKSETSSWLREGLLAIVRGPLMHDVHLLYAAMDGPGTKEKILNDVLLSRTNADLNAMKGAYHRTFGRRLEDAVKGDLSMKTERHFMIVLGAQRVEDSAPVVRTDIDRDVNDLYSATEAKLGTDEVKVCSILSTRNDNQIRAISFEYEQRYARKLEAVIHKEFSGHMQEALLYQLRNATDKYMHQAQLLEDAMAGMGTKDHLLVSRLVRAHWDRNNMMNVRGAYEKRYRTSLANRIKGETSGDYMRLMLACIGESI